MMLKDAIAKFSMHNLLWRGKLSPKVNLKLLLHFTDKTNFTLTCHKCHCTQIFTFPSPAPESSPSGINSKVKWHQKCLENPKKKVYQRFCEVIWASPGETHQKMLNANTRNILQCWVELIVFLVSKTYGERLTFL